MTVSSIIVLCGIVSGFLLFAGALAWGDFYSRKRVPGRSAQQEQPKAAAMPLREAA
jgi:hypothetical protein